MSGPPSSSPCGNNEERTRKKHATTGSRYWAASARCKEKAQGGERGSDFVLILTQRSTWVVGNERGKKVPGHRGAVIIRDQKGEKVGKDCRLGKEEIECTTERKKELG